MSSKGGYAYTASQSIRRRVAFGVNLAGPGGAGSGGSGGGGTGAEVEVVRTAAFGMALALAPSEATLSANLTIRGAGHNLGVFVLGDEPLVQCYILDNSNYSAQLDGYTVRAYATLWSDGSTVRIRAGAGDSWSNYLEYTITAGAVTGRPSASGAEDTLFYELDSGDIDDRLILWWDMQGVPYEIKTYDYAWIINTPTLALTVPASVAIPSAPDDQKAPVGTITGEITGATGATLVASAIKIKLRPTTGGLCALEADGSYATYVESAVVEYSSGHYGWSGTIYVNLEAYDPADTLNIAAEITNCSSSITDDGDITLT